MHGWYKSPIYQIVMRLLTWAGMSLFLLVILASRSHALDRGRKGYIGSFEAASPMSLATDGKSRLFIASMWGRVTVTDLDGKELSSFGGPGSALEGKLLEPSGMYYFDDRLYIADSWYGHVIVLTPEGKLVQVYGMRGRGAKQFTAPKGIFVHNGLMFVADTGNARVQVLGPNGVFLREFGTNGESPEKLREPESLVVLGKGSAYVIDVADKWLKIYDIQGDYIDKVSRMRVPVDIALAGGGYLVSDIREGVIQLFNLKNVGIGSLGPWGPKAKPFRSISGVATAGDMVYASDYDGNEIKVFRVPGLEKRSMEEEKTLIPWVAYMDEISVPGTTIDKLEKAPDGQIFALDGSKGRIFRLDAVSGAEGAGPESCFASSFTFGPEGNIYCLDLKSGKIIISEIDGVVSRELDIARVHSDESGGRTHADIGVSSQGEIFVSDSQRGQIDVYEPSGEYRGALGQGGTNFYIKEPVAIRVSGNIVYVTDAGSRTVFIYSTKGRLIRELWDIVNVKQPAAIAISTDYIYILDAEGPDVKIFSKKGMHVMSFGSKGSAMGEFSEPASIELDAEGNVIVSDPGNERIQRFSVTIEQEYEDDMWEEKSLRQHNINKNSGQEN